MGSLIKTLSLLLVLALAASSLIMVQIAGAQSILKPPVPEFSVKIIAHPYDVAPVTTINPYTGQMEVKQGGYHSDNVSIEIAIKNRHFTPYKVSGSYVSTYYQVQYKGSFGSDWHLYRYPGDITPIAAASYISQSESDYTVISIPLEVSYENFGNALYFLAGEQIDFRVRALVGDMYVMNYGVIGFTDYLKFDGETGDWSGTQTITIDDDASTNTWPFQNSALPTNSSNHITYTISADVPQIATFAFVAVIAVLLAVIAVLLYKRGSKQQSKHSLSQLYVSSPCQFDNPLRIEANIQLWWVM
jgi:hypothetical protein